MFYKINKNNIYSYIIMSEQQLRNRILNILDNTAKYDNSQFTIGGASIKKTKAKAKAKAKPKPKAMGTQTKYTTRKASEAKKTMDFRDMIEQSNIRDKLIASLDVKPPTPQKKPLTAWQQCVKRYGVRGAKDLYDKNTKICNLTAQKSIDPVQFMKYVISTEDGKRLIEEFVQLRGGGLVGGARKKMTKNQQALAYLKSMGNNLTESRKIIRNLKKLHGGNWWKDFKRGFMMPINFIKDAIPYAKTLAPLIL